MVGRPREFDIDSTLETILRAFWRDGFDKVTVAQLVTETGVGAPSLYAAFGDKQAMFDLAAARYTARLDAALARDLDTDTALEAVANVLRSAANNFAQTSEPAGCLVMAEPQLAERRELTRAATLRRLEAGYRAGEFAQDPAAVNEFLSVVLAGMAARAREGATQSVLMRAGRDALNGLALR